MIVLDTNSLRQGRYPLSKLFLSFFTHTAVFPGVLWSGAFTTFLTNLTEGAVDPFVWSDCKFGFFLMYFGFNYSSALLIILSIEKFIALYFPLKSKSLCTVRMARRVSLVTALIFVAFDSQFLVFGKVLSDQYGKYCYYSNVSNQHLNILFSIVIAIKYSFGPFVVMGCVNLAIIYKFIMASRQNRRGGTESTTQALSKSVTKGTAMLLTVSFAFIILAGPIALANVIWEEGTMPVLVFKSVIALQYLNHGINGVLYCISGTRFRTELLKTFTCLQKRQRSRRLHATNSNVLNSSHNNDTAMSELGASASAL